MTLIILIISIISYSLISIFLSITPNKFITESQQLELFWTVSPSLILILIGLPSIKLLYILDEVFTPNITIKTIGHQWYWSYEYSDFNDIEFDSYLSDSSNNNSFRLLDVDNKISIPINSQIRNLITAADVLHSWTIPSLGIKVDAVPGRLNQINFLCNSPGLFFGQCSEICGTNHRFIPITIESIPASYFINWIKKNISLNGWK
jgi:cytochrome c oxidase subunit 2